ncbi:MAG: SRPBCC family protein, partial [Gammaproteobacteria bacterium]
GLDGRLLGRPQWPQDSATARASLGLEAVEVREWLGMVFVRMRAGGPAFDAWIEGLAERVAPIDPGDMQFARREVYRVGANWKVYADNFLEAYHLPLVHPEYATTLDRSGYRYELAEHYSVQCSPFSDTPGYYGRLRDASAGDEAFYAFLFPVCMLNILPGRMQVNAIRPLGVHACEVIFDYYYAQDAAGADTQLVDEDSRVSARIQEEDREICEAVQRAMNSGAYRPGPLSPKEEPAVRHFQQRLRHIYRQQGASCE